MQEMSSETFTGNKLKQARERSSVPADGNTGLQKLDKKNKQDNLNTDGGIGV